MLVAVIFVVVAIPFVLLQGYKDFNISGYLRYKTSIAVKPSITLSLTAIRFLWYDFRRR